MLKQSNSVICFSGIASSKLFQALATDRLFGFDTLEKTQCLPLYRYTPEGQRVSNVTDWAIRRINDHYRAEWGDDYTRIAGDDGITAEDIFAYTYAVLHDPVYRHDYAVDLLREFPRLPLYHDFDAWARMGRELLDLHINFESAEPFSLERVDKDGPSTGSGPAVKVRLTADKATGTIVLDDKTSLTGVPSPPGATASAAAPPWSGSSTSTRSASPATPPSPPNSTPTASPTTRSASSTCCVGSAPSASTPWTWWTTWPTGTRKATW